MSEESPTLQQSSQATVAFSSQINSDSDRAYNLPFSGGNGTDSLPDWPVDEFFTNSEYGPNFSFAEHGSSKASYHIIHFMFCLSSLNVIRIFFSFFSFFLDCR
jgi:hypothetical protein